MLRTPIKIRAALSLYSLFVCFFACNTCYSCGPTQWLQDAIGFDLCTHLSTSDALLKFTGLALGVTAIMGLKKIIDQEERRYQQSILLPDTLQNRVSRRRPKKNSPQEINPERAQAFQAHATPSHTTQKMQARAKETARLKEIISSLNQKLTQKISEKTEFEQNACGSDQKKMNSYNKKIAQLEVTIRLLKQQLPEKEPRGQKEATRNQEIDKEKKETTYYQEAESLYARQYGAMNSFLMLDTDQGKKDFYMLTSGCEILDMPHQK